MNEEIVNQLKQEYLENYEKGVNTDVSVFYIDGAPFKSDNLKTRVFSAQGLRGDKVQETIDKEQRDRMELMAEMNQVIYDRRKAFGRNFFGSDDRKAYKNINNQNVKNYKFVDIDNDLTGLFVNDDKKEVVIATRGILPGFDRKDTLQTIPMVRDYLLEKEKPESFGRQFKKDRKMVDEIYRRVRINYPDYKIVKTGHSRGGAVSVYLGRKWDLEYHAFSPVGNKADYIDSVPVENGNIYYHTKDPVSYNFHKRKGLNVEQHYELFNTRIYPHSTKDFFDTDSVVVKYPKLTKAEQLGMEEEILLDMKTKDEDIISAEDYVLSDLGIFDGFKRKDYNARNDPKNKKTIALLGDIPTERGIFNEYIPSVYNDLSIRPAKPFKPNITFDEIDGDKNQIITYNEFEKFFIKKGLSKNRIRNIFNSADVDKNNSIDRNEFRSISV